MSYEEERGYRSQNTEYRIQNAGGVHSNYILERFIFPNILTPVFCILTFRHQEKII